MAPPIGLLPMMSSVTPQLTTPPHTLSPPPPELTPPPVQLLGSDDEEQEDPSDYCKGEFIPSFINEMKKNVEISGFMFLELFWLHSIQFVLFVLQVVTTR